MGLPGVALLWLAAFPGSAVGGYDIAHIVERTCDRGGALIVTDEYKAAKDEGETLTEPGEVIGCPPAGPAGDFQIAAGPERIGRDRYVCTYVSLLNGDGADTCILAGSLGDESDAVLPLIVVLPDPGGRLTLVGTLSQEVAEIEIAPPGASSGEATLTPIDLESALRVGARRAFGYFSVTVSRPGLCAGERPSVLATDDSGRRIGEGRLSMSSRLLSAADRVPHSTSLRQLCASSPSDEASPAGWLTRMGAALRSVLGAWLG